MVFVMGGCILVGRADLEKQAYCTIWLATDGGQAQPYMATMELTDLLELLGTG
jgi:hypothetical protein